MPGDINLKVGLDAMKNWGEIFGLSCNNVTNDRRLHLLEFASYSQ